MEITNKLELPQALVNAIQAVRDEYDSGGSYVSASSITLPPRIYHLKKRYSKEVPEDASDLIWSLVGTILHSAMEKGANDVENEIVEKRLYKEVLGVLFSGQFDSYDFRDGTLRDYKFTSVYTVMAPVKFEYEAQANMLRLLLHEAGYEVNELELVYVIRDWSKMKSKTTRDYPKFQVQKTKVKMWTLEEAEQFLIDRVSLLKVHEDTPDDELPYCTDKDMWKDPDKWAVYKDKKAKRATKLFEEELDAKVFMAKYEDGRVEFRPSEARRCESYCNINFKCNQYLGRKNGTKV